MSQLKGGGDDGDSDALKFKNTLRNKLVFLWVLVMLWGLLIIILNVLDGGLTSWQLTGLLVFSTPLILQLIFNYLFRE